MWQVRNAFDHLQTMLDYSSIREIAPQLALWDRLKFLQVTSLMSNLISISQHGSSTPDELLKALRSGLAKLPDALKKLDPQLAKEFDEVARNPSTQSV
jgi:hypothetical protein